MRFSARNRLVRRSGMIAAVIFSACSLFDDEVRIQGIVQQRSSEWGPAWLISGTTEHPGPLVCLIDLPDSLQRVGIHILADVSSAETQHANRTRIDYPACEGTVPVEIIRVLRVS